jgi:hypothetical protein
MARTILGAARPKMADQYVHPPRVRIGGSTSSISTCKNACGSRGPSENGWPRALQPASPLDQHLWQPDAPPQQHCINGSQKRTGFVASTTHTHRNGRFSFFSRTVRNQREQGEPERADECETTKKRNRTTETEENGEQVDLLRQPPKLVPT